MAKIGDLKDLLGMPNTPEHLKWLDVDGSDYREFVEALPKQNLQVIPDLEAAWSFLGERSPYNLSSDHVERVSPFWEDVTPIKITDEEMEKALLTSLRQNLARGVSIADAQNFMEKNFSYEVRQRHASVIADTLKKEGGLLGVVYDDARLYPRCASGEGKTAKKSTKILLAKAACTSCVHHQNGRCAVLDKEVVFDVDYNEDLWETVAPTQFIALEDKFARLQTLPVKQRIQVAHRLLEKNPEYKRATLDARPVIAAPQKLSNDQAREAVASLQDTQQILRDVFADRKREVVASYMMEHGTDLKVRNLIASDSDLSPLKGHMHVLGSLYLDLSFFPTWDAAKTWTDKHAHIVSKVPYLVGTPYGESASSVKNASRDALVWTSPEVLGSITARYALYKGLTNDAPHLASFVSSLKNKSAKEIQIISQKIYSQPLSKVAKTYDNLGMMTYHVKTGMTLREARAHLALHGYKSYATDGGKLQNQRIQIARVMATGQHDKMVRAVIAKHPHLTSLKGHVFGHGHYYLDRRLFASDEDMTSFLHRHSSKKALPVIESANPWSHPQVRAAVLANLHRVGYSKVSSLEGLSDSNVQAIAVKISQLPSIKAQYDDIEQKGKKLHLTAADTEGALNRMRAKKEAKLHFDAADFARTPWIKRTAGALQGGSKEQLKTLLARVVEVENRTLLPDAGVYQFHSVRKMAQAWSTGKPMREHLATLTPVEVLSHAPIIAAFRNEEGLYGHAYMIADAYENCKVGAKAAAPTVSQIVKADKCVSCMYRKDASCSLYQATLVEEPVYTKQEAMRHAGLAHKGGRLDKAAFQGLVSDLVSGRKVPRDVIRIANLSRVSLMASKGEFSGSENTTYFGQGVARDASYDPSKILTAARLLVAKGNTRRTVVSRLQASFEPYQIKSALASGLVDILKTASKDEPIRASAASNGVDQLNSLEIGTVNSMDHEMLSTKKDK